VRILYLSADYGIPILGNKGGAVHVRELTKAFQELGHDVIAVTPCVGFRDVNKPLVDLVEVCLPELESEIIRRLRENEKGIENKGGVFKEVRSLITNRAFHDQIEAIHKAKAIDFIYERYSLWNFSGITAAESLKVPYILEVNAPLTVEQERYRSLHMKSLAQGIEEVLFQKADTIIAVSEGVKEYIGSKGVPIEKVHVTPNAVDPVQFDPDEIDAQWMLRERLSLPDSKFIVGFLGSLKKWHGVEILIEAMKVLISSFENFHLLIVGNGPLRESIEEQFSREGIQEYTTLAGEIPYTEVPSYLKSMDVTVAPYTRIPDFYFSPLKIFEYMAMEKPVIASGIGQIKEIVDDGRTGLLFEAGNSRDLAEKIMSLRDNPELMKGMGTEARKSILHKRTWKNNASEILSIVEGI
jgi:glycosyltransferase involved in cell wall biosynthesis